MTIAMRTDDPYEHTRGACDLQIHAGPDLFKRIGDDEDIAIAARNAGMDAICIKGHALNTARSAYFASKHVPGIHIFGGVVLNWSVGGIEPSAAIASFEVGGKAVWLPTYDAQYHAEIFGMTGSYATHEIPKEKMLAEGHGGSHLDFVIKGAGTKPGISVLQDGKLTKAAIEVVEVVKEYNGFLGTSHVSPTEISALVEYVRKTGGVNMLITHPLYMVPNCSPAFLKEVCGGGIYAELCTGIIWPSVSKKTVDDQVEVIRTIGAENCILSSDGGITYGTMPPEMLRVNGRLLRNAGISNEELNLMMRVNPKKVLNI
jgi:hypothetical protein